MIPRFILRRLNEKIPNDWGMVAIKKHLLSKKITEYFVFQAFTQQYILHTLLQLKLKVIKKWQDLRSA